MASGDHLGYCLQSQRSLPGYNQLKEERDDLEMIEESEALAGTIAIRMQSQPVYGVPTPPRDHIIWSLCTMCYINIFCLGFMAFVFSVKARDRKVVGDYSGAASYGSTAKWLNITALLLSFLAVGAIFTVVFIFVFST